MPLPQRLKNVLNKSKTQRSDVCRTITLFAKEFGYTPEQMWKIPLPTFLVMLEEWGKQVEMENRQMKSRRKK